MVLCVLPAEHDSSYRQPHKPLLCCSSVPCGAAAVAAGLCCREKDLDEVLQTTAIFANVGKGVMAAKEDLQVG